MGGRGFKNLMILQMSIKYHCPSLSLTSLLMICQRVMPRSFCSTLHHAVLKASFSLTSWISFSVRSRSLAHLKGNSGV